MTLAVMTLGLASRPLHLDFYRFQISPCSRNLKKTCSMLMQDSLFLKRNIRMERVYDVLLHHLSFLLSCVGEKKRVFITGYLNRKMHR